MEREIKFRGKRKDNGEWIYGYLIGKDVIVGEIVDWNEEYFQTEFWWKVIPETVGQLFTPDGNPNFFEGDIIADTYNLSTNTDPETIEVITYENFQNRSCTEFLIGNIHDNPELLKSA